MARGSANEIGRVAKRFSVICLRMASGPQARPCPESGHVQVSFRETKEGGSLMRARAGRGAGTGTFYHLAATPRCEPGRGNNVRVYRRATRDSWGEVYRLPFSTSFLSVSEGKGWTRKNGRVDLGILSVAFFFFSCIPCRIVDRGVLAKSVRGKE